MGIHPAAYEALVPCRSTSPLGVVRITASTGSRDGAWLALRSALWPQASEAEQLSAWPMPSRAASASASL
jgi:hypothetical protein